MLLITDCRIMLMALNASSVWDVKHGGKSSFSKVSVHVIGCMTKQYPSALQAQSPMHSQAKTPQSPET